MFAGSALTTIQTSFAGFGTYTYKSIRVATAGVKVTFELPEVIAKTVQEATGEGNASWDLKRGLLKRLGIVTRFKAMKFDVRHRQTVELLPEPADK